jgi:cytochrome P450
VLATGSKVMLCLGAVNHDTARSPHAGRLLLDRTDTATLPFGAGPRYCLGGHLGRLVTGSTLTDLFRRCPSLLAERHHDSVRDIRQPYS